MNDGSSMVIAAPFTVQDAARPLPGKITAEIAPKQTTPIQRCRAIAFSKLHCK
jgi:hypothetical protein